MVSLHFKMPFRWVLSDGRDVHKTANLRLCHRPDDFELWGGAWASGRRLRCRRLGP